MSPVELLPAANRDIIAAAEWYDSPLRGLGIRFVEDLDSTITRIEQSREQFPVVFRRTQRALLKRFPFRVLFNSYDDRTLIVAIIDLRRNPGQWRDRT